MRQVLRLLGRRNTMALGIVLLIGAVVLAGRIAGGSRDNPVIGANTGAAASPTATASTEADDGLSAPGPTPSPSTSPGAPPPQTVATDFTRAWLAHNGVTSDAWLAGLSRYATASLRQRLKGVDPAGVPANAMNGDVSIVDHSTSYVDAVIPLDSGTLDLRLIATEGRWLVDGVDWQRT